MVIMVLVGIRLDPKELMGIVCGDLFTKVGEDFIRIFPLRLELVLPFRFGMILGVRRDLFENSSPLFLCLLRIEM